MKANVHARGIAGDENAAVSIGDLVGALLFVVVGLAFAGTVQDSADSAVENSTGAAAGLYGLVPLIYVLMVIGGAVAFIALQGGFIGSRR